MTGKTVASDIARNIANEIPRKILARKIVEKFRVAGVTEDIGDKALSISSALFDGDTRRVDEVFSSIDGDGTIHIDQNDIEDVLAEFRRVRKKYLPDAVNHAMRKTARSQLKHIIDDWPNISAPEEIARFAFERNLDSDWGKGLRFLQILIWLSRDLGETAAQRLSKSKARKGFITKETIIRLHARACLIADEIYLLSKSGFADGAMARWRTLHEIHVTIEMLLKHGDNLAIRYLDHEAVERFKWLSTHDKTTTQSEKISINERIDIESEYETVIEEYGNSFKGHYGWAAYHTGEKSPNFQTIEQHIGEDALRLDYKLASFGVHASVPSLNFSFAIPSESDSILIAGASNYGLEIPATQTASKLALCTIALLWGRDKIIEGTNVVLIGDIVSKANKELLKSAKELNKRMREVEAFVEETATVEIDDSKDPA